MKYLKKFKLFEQLFYSNDIAQILEYIDDEPVARLLMKLQSDVDFYDDDEFVNYLDISDNPEMIKFLPTKDRGEDDELNYEKTKMPTRIGRIINQILNRVKRYFTLKTEHDVIVSEDVQEKNHFTLIIPRIRNNPKHTFIFDNEGEPSKITITIEGVTRGVYYQLPQKQVFQAKLKKYTKSFAYNKGVFYFIEIEADESFSKFRGLELKAELEATTNINIKESQIESFVRKFTGYIKSNKSGPDAKIEIVKGEEIRYWYDCKNYKSYKGQLGSSCMASEDCTKFMDIYCENKDVVSMLILKQEGKLVGRALLWKLSNGNYFMDRVYTALDADREVFYNYAIEKEYFYKKGPEIYKKKSIQNNRREFAVAIKHVDYDYYPYLDTFKYLEKKGKGGVLTIVPINYEYTLVLNRTDGGVSYLEEGETL